MRMDRFRVRIIFHYNIYIVAELYVTRRLLVCLIANGDKLRAVVDIGYTTS